MIASLQNHGHSIAGIRIGISDAKQHFPEGAECVDLELDHLRIRCELHTDLWGNRAEISDPRLRAWLEEKFYWQKLPTFPVSVELIRSGESYRLHVVRLPQPAKAGFGLSV